MKLFDILKQRNMIKDISDTALAKKFLNEQKTRFYCGFDPSSTSLTVGHLVQVVRSKILQSFGHTPIIVIGGATGLIGDPKQNHERKLISLESSLENSKHIEAQLRNLLGDNAIYLNNYEWLKDINLVDYLREYGKFFPINYMLSKDTISKRLEKGISYTEFSYMIIQSIDFLHLYNEYNCKIQFGGSDQWGNITSGLELIRKKNHESEVLGLSSPLLLKSDGTKFGKSESGTLWLDKELTSPYELYQYFLNSSDQDVINYLKLLTTLNNSEINEYQSKMNENPGSRLAQKKLAEEVVIMVHGIKELNISKEVTNALFYGKFDNLAIESFEILEKTLQKTSNMNLIEALIELKLASSKREAREFINNNAIQINGKKINELDYKFLEEKFYHNKYLVIRRGKKKYGIVKKNVKDIN